MFKDKGGIDAGMVACGVPQTVVVQLKNSGSSESAFKVCGGGEAGGRLARMVWEGGGEGRAQKPASVLTSPPCLLPRWCPTPRCASSAT